MKRVYSDWLIERGDPRGELISLELAARTDDRDAQARLAKHIAAHHARHDPRMLGTAFEHRRVIDVRWGYGFLAALRISYGGSSAPGPSLAELLDDVLALPVALIVRELALGGTGRDDPADGRYAAALAVIARLAPPLASLHLGDIRRERGVPTAGFLGDLEPAYPALATLRDLIVDAGALRFGRARLPELRRLDLGASWTPAMLDEVAAAEWPRLHTLCLDGVDREPEELAGLLRVRAMPAMREIRIRAPSYTRAIVELLAGSPLAAQLTRLHLSEGALLDEDIDRLAAALARLPTVQMVNLDAQRDLSRAGVRRLASITGVIG